MSIFVAYQSDGRVQVQIGGGVTIPVVHTVELLDWATGGPRPQALEQAP